MLTIIFLVATLVTLFVLALLVDQDKRDEMLDRALSDEYPPLETNADVPENESMDPRVSEDILTKRTAT
jgi:hypothetical protein